MIGRRPRTSAIVADMGPPSEGLMVPRVPRPAVLDGAGGEPRLCAAIETVPGKMGGQPVVRGTRVRPKDLLVNRSEGLDWLSENFTIPVDTIREVFSFYDRQKSRKAPAPA